MHVNPNDIVFQPFWHSSQANRQGEDHRPTPEEVEDEKRPVQLMSAGTLSHKIPDSIWNSLSHKSPKSHPYTHSTRTHTG